MSYYVDNSKHHSSRCYLGCFNWNCISFIYGNNHLERCVYKYQCSKIISILSINILIFLMCQWDTLFWLGGFITIAQQLSEAGASKFLGVQISHATKHFNLPVLPSLAIAYFLTTFLFSSLSAHIVAFASTFLDAGHMLGANPMVLTALIAYFGVLAGCMTNFSTGKLFICVY